MEPWETLGQALCEARPSFRVSSAKAQRLVQWRKYEVQMLVSSQLLFGFLTLDLDDLLEPHDLCV